MRPSPFSLMITGHETDCGLQYCKMLVISSNRFVNLHHGPGGLLQVEMNMTPHELFKFGATLQEAAREALDIEGEVSRA